MYFWYSESVVAPMARSSPRASAGLSMLEASMAPSAAPAPISVCSSSMKRMIVPWASSISLRTAFSRSSNSPRYLAPAIIAPRSSETTRLFFRPSGHVAHVDAPREALDDRRLADAGLADQDRVVLRAPGEDLDDAADLLVAADDRIDLAPAGEIGEVARVALQRLVLVFGVGIRDAVGAADFLQRLQQGVLLDAGLRQPLGRRRRRTRPGRAENARSRRTRRRTPSRSRTRGRRPC